MKTKNAWQNIALGVAALLIFSASAFLITQTTVAQEAPHSQSDAIGIRVVPNPNHYSVSRWYESQGYSGSPQALTVDGYEALRDGRTVYINAAHVIPQSKEIYTNIYLISYNQDQSHLTTDILGQIISHWKFNDNLPDETASCSISALKCSSDVDCPSSQSCSLSRGVCELKEPKNCQVDDDCPTNYYCSSLKAKVIRDLNRVGKIEELRESLAKYRESYGNYPRLAAGTYLPGASTSLWPSWQEDFLPALGAKRSFLDPINRLGPCEGYDSKTCWDKDRQQFIYNKEGLILKLPSDSYGLVYTTNESASEYRLCAVMESRVEADGSTGYRFKPSGPQDSECVVATGVISGGHASNRPPQIIATALYGSSGLEYNGFVRASDPDGDPLTWSIQTSGDFSSWSEAPYLRSTSDPYQKKIFANRAGSPGSYPITITVRDDKGASASEAATIVIGEAGTMAETSEYIYRLDPVNQFNYSFYISGFSGTPQYNLSLLEGPPVLSYDGLKVSESNEGVNRSKITYSGVFSTGRAFEGDTESLYSLSVGGRELSRFIIKIKVDKPWLNFDCDGQLRISNNETSHDYDCYLGSSRQNNHTVSYQVDGLPAGLDLIEVEEENGSISYYIKGSVNEPLDDGEVRVTAANEYSTRNEKSFIFNVNTYCGDGVAQQPNSEGRGGMYNNGFEACDGNSNVALSAADSSKTRQYACNTPRGTVTPYPIPSYDYCVFKSPLDGGGYCGDSYCQVGMEDKESCPFDCDPGYSGMGEILEGDAEIPDCENNEDCPDGYTCDTGVCEISCWDVPELVSKVTFSSGDAVNANKTYYREDSGRKTLTWSNINVVALNFLQGYDTSWDATTEAYECKGCDWKDLRNGTVSPKDCCVVYIDNPHCSNPLECPPGYTNLTKGYGPLRNDSCYKKRYPWQSNWLDRYKYSCVRTQSVRRCFGDICRPSLGSTSTDGIMNSAGICEVTQEEPEDVDFYEIVKIVPCGLQPGDPGYDMYSEAAACNPGYHARYVNFDDYSPGGPCEVTTICYAN